MPHKKHWKSLFIYAGFSLLYAGLHILFQYYLRDPNVEAALVRGLAFTGATLVSMALSLSAIFKWSPRYAKFWRIRRYLGVSGFIYGAAHAHSVIFFYYQGNIASVYYSLNPVENPLVFGTIAYIILFIMAIISFDKAVQKLGRTWKKIQRLVYIGYPALIFHFLLTNPEALKTAPGYLLLSLTAFAIFGQLFWFFRTSTERGFYKKGTLIGFVIIIALSLLAIVAFK